MHFSVLMELILRFLLTKLNIDGILAVGEDKKDLNTNTKNKKEDKSMYNILKSIINSLYTKKKEIKNKEKVFIDQLTYDKLFLDGRGGNVLNGELFKGDLYEGNAHEV